MQDRQPTAEPGRSTPVDAPVTAQFLEELERSGRFHRDRGIGRIFHPGAVSYRETVPENCLHLVVEDGRISAHVDRFSPIRFTRDGVARYSFWRIAVHNISGMIKDALAALAGGRRSDRPAPVDRWFDVEEVLLTGGAHEELETAEAVLDRIRTRALARSDEGIQRVPFNLVDDVVHMLDSPAEPWTVQLELRVEGALDEARVRTALTEALGRHPMARARRAASEEPSNRNFWETPPDLDTDPLEVVSCPDDAALVSVRSELYSQGVDLTRSPPLRIRLVHTPTGDLVMLNLHHAASDGIGGLRLLQTLARAYTGAPDQLPETDFLAARDLMGSNAAPDASTRMRRYLVLAERLRELFAPPARLARLGGRHEAGYGFHHVSLTAAETQRLSDSAHPGSVNDLLLAALHLAIERWNTRHRRSCRRITVLVPSNLRPPDRPSEMVGNFSLPTRITTTPRVRRSAAAALAAVTRQTSRKKQRGMGTAVLELLSWSWLLPLSVKQAAISVLDRRFTDTAILSNLGRIDDPPAFGSAAGDSVELWFSAPARMPLGLSVGAITMGGRLHLSFRYRHPQFGPQAAQDFAACFVALLHTVSTGSGDVNASSRSR